MEGQKSRFLHLASLAVLSVPSTAAAIGGGTGVEASLVSFINRILIYEIESLSGVLLYFLAPIAGFYFIQQAFLGFGLKMFEERITENRRLGSRDDDTPTTVKGLAIVTSFITVQMLGAFSASILLATGILSIIMAGLMHFGILEDVGGGSSSSSRSSTSSSSSSSGGSGGQQQSSGGGSSGSNMDWSNLIQNAGGAINSLSGSDVDIGQDDSDRIKKAYEVFDSGDDPIAIMRQTRTGASGLRNDIQNAESNRSSSVDKNDLQSAGERAYALENELKKLYKEGLKEDSKGASYESGNSRLYQKLEVSTGGVGGKVDELIKKIDEQINRIDKNQKTQDSAYEDDLDKIWNEIQRATKAILFVQRLPYTPEEIVRDNSKVNEILNNSPSHLNWSGSTSDFPNEISSFKKGNMRTEYEDLIEEMEELLEKDMTFDEKELKILKKQFGETGLMMKIPKKSKNVPWYLEKLKEGIKSRYDVSDPTSQSNINDHVNQIQDWESRVNDIRKKSTDLYEEAQKLEKAESNVYKKVKEAHETLNG